MKTKLVVFFVLVVSLSTSACVRASNPIQPQIPVAEATAVTHEPGPSVIPVAPTAYAEGCDEGWLGTEYSERELYGPLSVPYQEEISFHYQWGGITWKAVLGCETLPYYEVLSDKPFLPSGPAISKTCGSTTFRFYGVEIRDSQCDRSLLFPEQRHPPQISIAFEHNGGMIYDLDYFVESVVRQDGTEADYLQYTVHAGYPDTGEWADLRCYTSDGEGGRYTLMGYAGARSLEDVSSDTFNAFCGGEGFWFTMETSR